MKHLLLLSTVIITFGINSAVATDMAMKDKSMEVTKHKTEEEREQAPEQYFTGKVMLGNMFSSGDYANYKGAMVHFENGARTNWHTHPLGQTLVITEGEGRAQSEGEAVQILQPGDVVWIPADVRHWHGAAPDQPMSHIAIQSPDEEGEVVNWMEAVSDEDYLSGEE